MKYEITKEQLKELAKGNAKVERWFPEAFETKLEVGKWYKSNDPHKETLIFLTKSLDSSWTDSCGYGFDWSGEWTSNVDLCNPFDARPATESEVFEALKKEAVKRGFY